MKFTDTPYCSLDESKNNFTSLIQKAKAKGEIIAISPSPVANEEQNQRLQDVIKMQEQICAENTVPYINIFPELHNQEFMGDLKDGVHPSEKGNALMAKAINAALKKYLA